jgi:hypothetical protein
MKRRIDKNSCRTDVKPDHQAQHAIVAKGHRPQNRKKADKSHIPFHYSAISISFFLFSIAFSSLLLTTIVEDGITNLYTYKYIHQTPRGSREQNRGGGVGPPASPCVSSNLKEGWA